MPGNKPIHEQLSDIILPFFDKPVPDRFKGPLVQSVRVFMGDSAEDLSEPFSTYLATITTFHSLLEKMQQSLEEQQARVASEPVRNIKRIPISANDFKQLTEKSALRSLIPGAANLVRKDLEKLPGAMKLLRPILENKFNEFLELQLQLSERLVKSFNLWESRLQFTPYEDLVRELDVSEESESNRVRLVKLLEELGVKSFNLDAVQDWNRKTQAKLDYRTNLIALMDEIVMDSMNVIKKLEPIVAQAQSSRDGGTKPHGYGRA